MSCNPRWTLLYIQERHKTLTFKENEYDNLRGRVVDVVSKALARL